MKRVFGIISLVCLLHQTNCVSNNVCPTFSDYYTIRENENCWYNFIANSSAVSQYFILCLSLFLKVKLCCCIPKTTVCICTNNTQLADTKLLKINMQIVYLMDITKYYPIFSLKLYIYRQKLSNKAATLSKYTR